MTAAQWLDAWIKEFPYDEELIRRERAKGTTDEDIKSLLESFA